MSNRAAETRGREEGVVQPAASQRYGLTCEYRPAERQAGGAGGVSSSGPGNCRPTDGGCPEMRPAEAECDCARCWNISLLPTVSAFACEAMGGNHQECTLYDILNPWEGRLAVFTSAQDLALAHALADTIATGYFRQPLVHTQTKADGSPVTEADRLIEKALSAQLVRDRPNDSFVGEESGAHGHGRRRWFIDPIDGTASFAAGRPDWRTLIAVEDNDDITMGLVSTPALGQRWWATCSDGAWFQQSGDGSDSAPAPLAVTDTRRLRRASVATWPLVASLPQPLRASGIRLAAHAAQLNPQGGMRPQPPVTPLATAQTNHGALLVAAGRLDVFLLAGCGPWDVAAMVPIVEEAGGRFSDITGGRALDAGAALFSNGVLHEEVLRCICRSGSSVDGL